MKTDAWGIQAQYEDAAGKMRKVSKSLLPRIRAAMGDPPPPALSWHDEQVKVIRQDEPFILPADAVLMFEDGSSAETSSRLPHPLPIGYHKLMPACVSGSFVRLIVTPGRCHLPESLRIWGWSAQLYATRSTKSWGMGDLADLVDLARWAAPLGAQLLLINPLHAVPPLVPQEASPYSPSSRRFLNPLYLRIEDLPEAKKLGQELSQLAAMGRALNTDRHIDRDRVYHLKQEALQLLWNSFEGDEDFDRFQSAGGRSLRQYALHCCLVERYGSDWRRWPAVYRHPDSAEAEPALPAEVDRITFHMWQQWLLGRQLTDAGQIIPLMQDLPIGFSPDGADAWTWQDVLAAEMTVGAPPDLFNATGQDWGLPPFIPHKLRATGYQPFIETIRSIICRAGGLRIDHVMGLFRLWWVPRGSPPKDGAFVRYAAEELLAILAVESTRAQAIVVGEDLGTVEEGVRETLAEQNVLSYRLLWFEDQPPSQYPWKALASVTTHDLPTLAGVWTGADLESQRKSGASPDEKAQEQFRTKLVEVSQVEDQTNLEEVITKTFSKLAESPCAVVMADLEAACAVTERPNMPTSGGNYPNWSLALPCSLEELTAAERPAKLAHILNRRVGDTIGTSSRP
ncbi:MAG TPA: 4-alpha-glucanotransferase [Nitrospira sp.]|nr:4-alpha-glucanotransferase [Nitrospira sp.]